MNRLVPIKSLFLPVYGVNLELLNLEITDKLNPQSIPFISRKEFDNGLAAYVKRIDTIIPNPAHTISVAVSGSVLSSFYQSQPYYSGRDIYYLLPLKEMSIEEMLFYAFCLQANKYRYNYGRGANRTLKNLLVPDEMPDDFRDMKITQIDIPKLSTVILKEPELRADSWNKFFLNYLFDIKKGKRLTKEDMEFGDTPFVAAIDSNNGWREFIGQAPIHIGNTITVNYNGSVAEAFYQPYPFWASDDVNVLYPKFDMNIYIATFIITIIEQEKYRFNYGRKWHVERMEKSEIRLPTKDGKPDFSFMENYIKSLPYSTALLSDSHTMPIKAKVVNVKPIEGLSEDELIKKYETSEAIPELFTNEVDNLIKSTSTSSKSNHKSK